MNTLEMLDSLQHKAFVNDEIRLRLLSVINDSNPLMAFCKIAKEYGYELYPMDIIYSSQL